MFGLVKERHSTLETLSPEIKSHTELRTRGGESCLLLLLVVWLVGWLVGGWVSWLLGWFVYFVGWLVG